MNNEMKQNLTCYPPSTKKEVDVISLEKICGDIEATIYNAPTSINLPKSIHNKFDCTLEESYGYYSPTKIYFCNEKVYKTTEGFLCQSDISNGMSNSKLLNFDINHIDTISETLLKEHHTTDAQCKTKSTKNDAELKDLEMKKFKTCMPSNDSYITGTENICEIASLKNSEERNSNIFQQKSYSNSYYNYPVNNFLEDFIEYYHDNLGLSGTNKTISTILESTLDESLINESQVCKISSLRSNDLNANCVECKYKNQMEIKITSVYMDEITSKCDVRLHQCNKNIKSSHQSTNKAKRIKLIKSNNTHQKHCTEKLQHNYNDCTLCLHKYCTCRNVERIKDEMSIENRKNIVTNLQGKEAWGRQCKICFQKFERQEYFTHIRHCHFKSYPYQCEYCKFMCQDLNQLRHHVKKKHKTDVFKIINHVNNKESFVEDSYNFSKNNIEEDIFSDEEIELLKKTRKCVKDNVEVTFNCPLCFRKLKTLPNLKKHIVQHSQKKLQCYFCKFTSSFKGQMCSHYNQKHPSEKLQWKEVFLDIEEPHQLVKDIEPYLLQVKIKYGIRKPNKENNQLRQYQCPYCNYTCNFNSSYNRHLRIHAGKKPYKCGYCNFHAREPYVIRKHSKIKHLNEEVKIEKDIYYNVPYRYSNESKIKSTKNTKIKLKNQNKQKSKKVSEKVDNSNLDMELVSNSFALKNSTVINQIKPSLISKYKLHMKENEFEKDQDYNNYEANKDLKDSYMHSEVAIESKETKVATSNKEIVYSKNTILNNFTNFTSNDLQNTQLKLRYDSVEKTFNMDSPLLKVSENIKGSHQNSVNASKSKSEFIFENDAKSLMLIQCPLSSDKQKLCQETSNVNKNLSKVDGIDANLTKKSEDNCLNLKKFYQQQDEAVSKRHSIILCEDNDFNNKTVVIRLCSVNLEEITGDNFKTKLSESIRIDNIKEMYETLSANGDISVDTYDVAINSSHEISQCESFLSLKQRNQECSNTIETEKEIQDAKINESLQLETNSNVINEFEILKSSVIYPNQNKGYKELDVHKCGLKVDYFENNIGCLTDLMPQDLSNDPVTIPSVLNQNMLGLDYQNRDYFSPDKIRNMMNNLGNGRIECTICSVTTTRRAFYKHAKKHFNIKPFQCGYCNYRSIEKSKIRVHNSFCHPGSQCIIIKLSPNTASMDVALSNLESTEYSDAIDFSKNVSSHSNDKKKKLNVRGKLSTKLRVKETESLSASGWFRCPVCQKELRYHLPTLRRHLYTHFNYKPFKCGLCPFTASDGGEVRGHHITHRSTDEAKVEISGAVMHPDLAKLLVDSFGYSQLDHHEIDFPSKKKIKRKNASVSNVTMGNLEQEEILSSAGSEDNICSDSTNYKERDLNEFHLSPDCICENGDVKHVRVTGVI